MLEICKTVKYIKDGKRIALSVFKHSDSITYRIHKNVVYVVYSLNGDVVFRSMGQTAWFQSQSKSVIK